MPEWVEVIRGFEFFQEVSFVLAQNPQILAFHRLAKASQVREQDLHSPAFFFILVQFGTMITFHYLFELRDHLQMTVCYNQ